MENCDQWDLFDDAENNDLIHDSEKGWMNLKDAHRLALRRKREEIDDLYGTDDTEEEEEQEETLTKWEIQAKLIPSKRARESLRETYASFKRSVEKGLETGSENFNSYEREIRGYIEEIRDSFKKNGIERVPIEDIEDIGPNDLVLIKHSVLRIDGLEDLSTLDKTFRIVHVTNPEFVLAVDLMNPNNKGLVSLPIQAIYKIEV